MRVELELLADLAGKFPRKFTFPREALEVFRAGYLELAANFAARVDARTPAVRFDLFPE